MGAQIAAHLGNAGLPVLLLDMVPPDLLPGQSRSRLAAEAVERLRKQKPAPFMDARAAALITPGNFEDHLAGLADVDWVIEAVAERLDIKQALWRRVGEAARPGTVLSTNTSGLSCRALAEMLPVEHRPYFLGIHFFNPPRYMKLVEIIPTPETDAGVVSCMREFAEKALGKGTVLCNDTVNFIANRVGGYALLVTLRAMAELGLGVDAVDAITGPAMGRPASATFRTLDLVGVDTFYQVSRNTAERITDPEERDLLELPAYVSEMIRRGWVGDKAGQGFFKKVRGANGESVVLSLDLRTLEYGPRVKPDYPSLEQVRRVADPGERLRILTGAADPAGQFAWKVTSRLLAFCAAKAGEIANHDVNAIDRALRWGYNWEIGPFEIWNALGVQQTIRRMEADGLRIPDWVRGVERFPVDRGAEQPLSFAQIRTSRSRVVRSDPGATLVDLGDEVLGFEFHYPKQAIGESYVDMARAAAEEVRRNWRGLVIAASAPNFCVGANVGVLLQAAREKNWEKIDRMIAEFHQTALLLKYLERPVVVAPHGTTIGGGAEIAMQCARTVAAAETYIGLVELGVGVIPAGGGTKEMAVRAARATGAGQAHDQAGLVRRLQATYEAILNGKVSGSATEAKDLGYLRPDDRIVMNQGHLLYEAKEAVLELDRRGYRPPRPEPVPVAGPDGRAVLELTAYARREGGHASEYDWYLARKLAFVLTGGNLPAGTRVPETYLLDLEREVFLQLMGEPKTQERMAHLLEKGGLLRN